MAITNQELARTWHRPHGGSRDVDPLLVLRGIHMLEIITKIGLSRSSAPTTDSSG